MATHREPTPSPRHRRRSGSRWRTGLLLGLLAVLVGRGLGWLGRGGAAAPGDAGTAPAVAAMSPPASSAGAAAPAPPAAPLAEAIVVAPPAGPALPAANAGDGGSPAVDADRFGSLLSLLQTESAAQRFGSALSILRQLRDLPLDAAQQAALVLPAAELQQGLAGACSSIVTLLAEGRVLAAEAAAERLLAAEGALVGPALVEAMQLLGVAGALGGLPAAELAPWPVPMRLAKGRLVRTQLAGAAVVGRVVDSRADEVTLRVPRAGGATFPTIPVVACEPLEPSAADAVEMGFAALQQGRGRLARLWLGCALLRGGTAGETPPRQLRLAELLR